MRPSYLAIAGGALVVVGLYLYHPALAIVAAGIGLLYLARRSA